MYWLGRLAVATVLVAAGPARGQGDSATTGEVRIETRDSEWPVYFERESRTVEIEARDEAIEVDRENGEIEIEREGKVERGLETAGRATDKAVDTAGDAVGKALEKAAEAMHRAGEWMQEHED